MLTKLFSLSILSVMVLGSQLAAAETKVGDTAPAVSAKNEAGQTVDLKDYHGKKFVVLYFYPKDFTGGCTLQAKRFAEDYATFAGKDAVVVGVSADPVESHEKFCAEYDLPFTLLADPDQRIAKAFGVGEQYGRRSTFLIDKEGKVAFIVGNVADIKRHNEVLLAELDTLGAGKVGPQVGQKAPDVMLSTQGSHKVWTLSSQKGKSGVVLMFSRGWVGYQCPHCVRQAAGARSAVDQMKDAGFTLVSVYPGSQEHAKDFLATAKLQESPKNPLLVDAKMQAAYAYNVVTDNRKGVKPATFVIDKNGVVRWFYVGKSASDRPDMETILTEVEKSGE